MEEIYHIIHGRIETKKFRILLFYEGGIVELPDRVLICETNEEIREFLRQPIEIETIH